MFGETPKLLFAAQKNAFGVQPKWPQPAASRAVNLKSGSPRPAAYRGFTKFSWSSCSTPPEATPVVSIKA